MGLAFSFGLRFLSFDPTIRPNKMDHLFKPFRLLK
jgi:hypothetical protein